MTNSRDHTFHFKTPNDDENEPFDLTLGDGGDKVTCQPSIDGLALLEFAAISSRNYTSGQRAAAILNFLRKAIMPSSWNRFEDFVQKYQVDIDGLGDICSYLSEVYTTYPTPSAEPSSAGQTTDGASSAEDSSGRG